MCDVERRRTFRDVSNSPTVVNGTSPAVAPLEARQEVVILDNSLVVTGALKSITAACRLLSHRYSFTFILDSRSSVRPFVEANGFRVETVPYVELSRKPKSLLAYLPALICNARRVLQIVDSRSAGLLHVNDVYNMLGVACKLLRPDLRLIQHVRLLRSSYIGRAYPAFAALVGRFADHVVCVSDHVMADFGQPRRASVHRIYDVVSMAERHVRAGRGVHSPTRFLYVGNYIRGKGQNHAIAALSEAIKVLPKCSLKLVGRGANGELDAEYVAQLRALAATLGVIENVEFADASDDIEFEMKGADVVLNLSESESFSMVCLEALVYGRPLIASKSGGPSEIVEDMKTGVLVSNTDPSSAASAMILLSTAPQLASDLARAGYEAVRTKFNPTACAERLAAVYSDH